MNTDKPPSIWQSLYQRLTFKNPQSKDTIVAYLQQERDRGTISAHTLRMIKGVLRVEDMQVREVMIPMARAIIIKEGASSEEIFHHVVQSRHSRFPVVGEGDKIVGILMAKYLIANDLQQDFHLESYIKEPVVIPESKRIGVLLEELRDDSCHMAAVVDEYANLVGVITLEDIIEQIVGEIEDETNVTPELITLLNKDTFLVDASVDVALFNDHFDADLSDDASGSIGGLVSKAFGYLPKVGETISVQNFMFKIVGADDRKITFLETTRSTVQQQG